MALAQRLDGAIINADSMQVYRDLSVLTARPSVNDEALVPHRLFGTVPGSVAFSAGQWLAEAVRELEAVAAAGRTAIVVGGTGLYFKALTEGLAPVPEIPGELRAFWRAEAGRLGTAALHEALRGRDPQTAARLSPSDTQRIVRALEVFEATGRPLADWQREALPAQHPAMASAMRLALTPKRDWLSERIVARAEEMLRDSGIEEVRRLRQAAYAPDRPVMKAIGVTEIGALLDGRATMEATAAAITLSTRRYAKRQSTWIRGQMADWLQVDPAGKSPMVLAEDVLDRLGTARRP
jgi:tRNA dimethylallyltransferase